MNFLVNFFINVFQACILIFYLYIIRHCWNRPYCIRNGLILRVLAEVRDLYRLLEYTSAQVFSADLNIRPYKAFRAVSVVQGAKDVTQPRKLRYRLGFLFNNQQKPPCYNTDNSINVRPGENGNAVFRRFC